MAEHLAPDAPLIAETGGLNAMIVDSTALPEQAVRDIVASAFQSAGQRCSARRAVSFPRQRGKPRRRPPPIRRRSCSGLGAMGVTLQHDHDPWGESPPRRHQIIKAAAAYHSAASGRRTGRAGTRRLVQPRSNKASNWPRVSRTVPSSIPGHAKPARASRRVVGQHQHRFASHARNLQACAARRELRRGRSSITPVVDVDTADRAIRGRT